MGGRAVRWMPVSLPDGAPRRLPLPQISPRTYERVTLLAVWLIGLIVVTGGAVRLTGSGLGCTDWPTCQNDKVIAPWQMHAWIEFGNRLVTGAVSIAVVVAVLGSLARRPRRRDLTWLSLGLVAGVIGQIVLGGIVVLSHLWPPFVMGHFILSQLLVLDAVVLVHRARRPDGSAQRSVVTPTVRRLSRVLVGVTALAIVTGTVVTGAGPHSGSNNGAFVRRLPFAVSNVARIHGTVDMCVLITLVALVIQLHRTRAPRPVTNRAEIVLVLGALQAAIGYTQYFTGVPVILVGLHVLGATVIWSAVVWFHLGLSKSVGSPAQLGDGDAQHGQVDGGNDDTDRDRAAGNLVAGR